MKVTFITSASFLDTAAPLINALIKHVEINLVINTLSKTEGHLEYFKLLDGGSKKLTKHIVFWQDFKTISFANWIKIFTLRRLIKGELIHSQVFNPQYYFLAKFFRKKMVVDIHDIVQHNGEQIRRGTKLLIGGWVKNASQIIIHNFQDIDMLKSRYNYSPSINMIPIGLVYLLNAPLQNKIITEKSTILFFGRISPYKGIEYLIKAVPLIKKEIANLKVILAGEGKYYFDIDYLKNDSTYEIINRYISNQELAELIQKSSIIVCPYTDATQSGVIMTAYAFNKPVIATNVGGIAEIVENGVTGLLVPPRNPEKLAEAITDLLKHPEKIKVMAENIRIKINEGKFSWDSIAKETIEVYKKAIQQK